MVWFWLWVCFLGCTAHTPPTAAATPADCASEGVIAGHIRDALAATALVAAAEAYGRAEEAVWSACVPLSPPLAADFLLLRAIALARVEDQLREGTGEMTAQRAAALQRAALLGVIWAQPTYELEPALAQAWPQLAARMEEQQQSLLFGELVTLRHDIGTWHINGVRTRSLPLDIDVVIQLESASGLDTLTRDQALAHWDEKSPPPDPSDVAAVAADVGGLLLYVLVSALENVSLN